MQHWKQNFFTIWAGQAVSQLSSSILQFAIVWYLTEKTGSALVLSAAMLAGFLPQGVLGPFIGVYIDRYSRKKIMIISDLMIALASLLLVIAGLGGRTLPVWLILSVLLARSVGSAFHNPSLQAVTPQIVPEDQLTRCAGYSQSLQSVSQILSPVLAAVVYSAWKLSSIVFLDVVGALAAVCTLCICHIPPLPARSEKTQKQPFLQEAAIGFRILRSNRGLFGLVLVSSLYTFALMPTSALFPLMSMSYFGGTNVHASIAEVVFSLGLLSGSLTLGKWGGSKNRIHTILFSFLLMSASLIFSGLLPPRGFLGFAVCSFFMGVSGPFYWGMYTPLLQQGFEPQYLGRVLSISSSVQLVVAPVALSVSGAFAEFCGVQNWFLIAGGLTLAAAFLIIGVPSIRSCDQKS